MKRVALISVFAAFSLLAEAQTRSDSVRPDGGKPTDEEVESAYRSKVGEGGSTSGARTEKRPVSKIRDWSLKYKRVGQSRELGFTVLRYLITAKRGNSCVEYRLAERIATGDAGVRMKPVLTIDSTDVADCR